MVQCSHRCWGRRVPRRQQTRWEPTSLSKHGRLVTSYVDCAALGTIRLIYHELRSDKTLV
jgi:hypothetical protein